MTQSPIRTAYARVQSALTDAAALWRWPHPQIRAASCWMDLMLEEVCETDRERLDEDQRFLVHDAFKHVLALATALRDGTDAPELRIAVDALLDAFEPMVSLADVALRRIALENEPIETALQWIDRERRA